MHPSNSIITPQHKRKIEKRDMLDVTETYSEIGCARKFKQKTWFVCSFFPLKNIFSSQRIPSKVLKEYAYADLKFLFSFLLRISQLCTISAMLTNGVRTCKRNTFYVRPVSV